jgi:hypothetical protein
MIAIEYDFGQITAVDRQQLLISINEKFTVKV